MSKPLSIRIVVTPDSLSPFMTAHWMGAAPRYMGSKEAWTLIHPYFGSSKISFGMICPKATTTTTSGFNSLSFSSHWASRIFTGWYTGIPAARAVSFTGGICMAFPRPFGLSGWENTACTLYRPASIKACSVPTAKSGVPINTTFLIILSPPRLFFCYYWAEALDFLFRKPLFFIGNIEQVSFHMSDVHDPVQMVTLVADCPCQQFCPF